MSIVDEEDMVVLCSKLKQFQSKLLCKWVQGLASEQRSAVFMKDASAVNKHSTSPPLEDKGEEDKDEEENGHAEPDADEDSDFVRSVCVCVCECVCVQFNLFLNLS